MSHPPESNSHSSTPERALLVPSEDGYSPYRDSFGLSSIPSLPHRDTNVTMVNQVGSPEKTVQELEKIDETPSPSPQPDPFSPPPAPGFIAPNQTYISPPDPEDPPPLLSRRRNDRMLFCGILVMILWPWAFFGTIWGLGGVQWNNSSARYVHDQPQRITFIVTMIGSIIRMISGLLFSFSIVRFGQEWIAQNNPFISVFDVSLLSAFRNQSWVWGANEWQHLINKARVVPVVMVGLCLAGFALVPPGTASLIAPTTFNKTAPLSGTELNFAPGDATCLSWLSSNSIQNNCDWELFNGMEYTTCLSENQMVDVLESGRGSMLALLSNSSGTSSLSQLGANDGLHFLGPLRGVLPIGPNGVPAFNNLQNAQNPFENPQTLAGMVSYNYTLQQQGLASSISCIYDTASPIRFGAIETSTLVLQYNGTCDPALGVQDVLENVDTYPALNTNNTLGYWACQSAEAAVGAPAYYIYLRGRANYETAIGNITCTVSPVQPQVFATTFRSSLGSFTASELAGTNTSSGSGLGGSESGVNNAAYPGLVEGALVGLGNVVWEAQNWQSNLVAESVITFGVKSLGLQPYQRSDTYLKLYEVMLQGILEYEATYSRLIYSTVPNPPVSCIRNVNGTVSYEVIGWFARSDQGGFLVPMTLVNLASLIILVTAIVIGEGEYDFDPTDTRPLLTAELESGRPTTVQWTDQVRYRQLPTHSRPM